MDLRKLKTLIDLVAESGIAELEVTEGEDKVRIVKHAAAPAPPPALATTVVAAAPAAPTPAALAAEAAAAAEAEEAAGHVVKSPMVGTFYRSPSPGAPAVHRTGRRRQGRRYLCIIEAMKLLNEIEADVGGHREEDPRRKRPAG